MLHSHRVRLATLANFPTFLDRNGAISYRLLTYRACDCRFLCVQKKHRSSALLAKSLHTALSAASGYTWKPSYTSTYVHHAYGYVSEYIRDSRTKGTMTCAASVLLTSKPVDVIFRPLHAAKRSREHKPYRALQSTLPLMQQSSLQLDSFSRERTKDSERNFQNIYYVGLSSHEFDSRLRYFERWVSIFVRTFVHIKDRERRPDFADPAFRMCLR